MKYSDLIPTHNVLRDYGAVSYWKLYFSGWKGSVQQWNLKDYIGPIVLMEIEDKLYIHDGHHRIYAAFKSGISISDLNIVIKKFTYKQLSEVNLSCGWVTPYDPRRECRTHILDTFKPYILSLASMNKLIAIDAIYDNSRYYKEERFIKNLYDYDS